MKHKRLVLFICVENACRSQMAKAFFNRLTKGFIRAESCGTKPANSINPKAIKVMKEVGIDINTQIPKLLTEDMMKKASRIITMGCNTNLCPAIKTEDWGIKDPKGKPLKEFRKIRDEIRTKVSHLIGEVIISEKREM